MHFKRLALALVFALSVLVTGVSGWLARSYGPPVYPYEGTDQVWDRLLQAHVTLAGVDYGGWTAREREALNDYLGSRRTVTAETYEAWGKDERLAFLINAHNALVVAAVLDDLKAPTMMDIGPFPKAVYYRPMLAIPAFGVLPAAIRTLGSGALIAEFRDPRVYFALANGARGGPTLAPRAWTAPDMGGQLDDAAAAFLADPVRNSEIDGKLHLSRVFFWHVGEFDHIGGVLPFVARYGPSALVAAAQRDLSAFPSYLPFDWTVNAI